jgi:pimeloyl-ACP methyl ester carboxylesterase
MRPRLQKMLSHKPAIFGLLVMLLTSYPPASYSADRHFIIKNPANTSIAIFVHGFTGEYLATWGKLPELLQKDPALDAYDFLFWGYPSRFFGANEKIGTTGQHLKTEIDFLPKTYDRVILIGHSMGGLVIRSYIVQTLIDGKGNDLKSIADVILFGTPNEGLGRADAIPKIVNDQIADLGLASELIVTLRKYWVQRVASAQRHDEYNRQIPTLAVAGYTDNFVPKESVKSFFLDTAITDGDHTSMVKPENTEHLTYRIIKTRLLRALGTRSVVPNGGIDVVDFRFIEEPDRVNEFKVLWLRKPVSGFEPFTEQAGVFPLLDVKLRNTGKEVVVLHAMEVGVSRKSVKPYPPEDLLCRFGGLQPSWEYNLLLDELRSRGEGPEKIKLELSQVIEPNKADRFIVTVGQTRYMKATYDLAFTLRFNKDEILNLGRVSLTISGPPACEDARRLDAVRRPSAPD